MAMTTRRHSIGSSSAGSRDHNAKTALRTASTLFLSSWRLLNEPETLQLARSRAVNSARQSFTPKFFLEQLALRIRPATSVGISRLSIKVTVPSAGKSAFLHLECSFEKSVSSEIGGAVSFGVVGMGDLEGRGLKRGGRGGGSSGIESSTDLAIGWKAFANTNGCGE